MKAILKLKTTFAIIFLYVLFFSCTKKDACETGNYGMVTVSNTSNNPYYIYVDGTLKLTVQGNSIAQDIQVPQGNNRELYAKQVSGYILYPTERTTYLNVIACSTYSWQIP